MSLVPGDSVVTGSNNAIDDGGMIGGDGNTGDGNVDGGDGDNGDLIGNQEASTEPADTSAGKFSQIRNGWLSPPFVDCKSWYRELSTFYDECHRLCFNLQVT